MLGSSRSSSAVRPGSYAGTFATEMVTVIGGLLAYRAVLKTGGDIGFSTYQLGRGFIALSLPPLMLGCGVALPRFVAKVSAREASNYLATALLPIAALLGAVIIVGGWQAHGISRAAFGTSNLEMLVGPLTIAIAGLMAHSLAYAYLRGLLRLLPANILQMFNLAVVPAAAALLTDSLADLFRLSGIATAGASFVALIVSRAPIRPASHFWTGHWNMMWFGLRRMPGDALGILVLVAPQTVAAHFTGTLGGGAVGFSVSTLALVSAVFAPIGVVLLPEASRLVAQGLTEQLSHRLSRILASSVAASAIAALAMLALAPFAVESYLGRTPPGTVNGVRIASLGIVPYALFMVARSVIDAVSERAASTRITATGASLFVSIAIPLGAATRSPEAITGAFVVATWVMCGLTLRELHHLALLRRPQSWRAAVSPRAIIRTLVRGGLET